ncbi:MAG: four helix bundle protein [Bacteroidota bacterium]
MKENNVIKEKSYLFALHVIRVYKVLSSEQREFVLSKQMLRSGTSIGANIREAEFGQSKTDFIHKLSISLKEANETEYWLMLLKDSGYIDEKTFNSIVYECIELKRLLTSIINTAKRNN